MWVLTGPFDGELGKTDFQKPKLLKPNKRYTLGRKGQPLVIKSSRVSRDHCVFTVGGFSVDDVANPSARPTLRVSNLSKKDKKLPIFRCEQNSTDEVQVDLESSGSYDLREGDRVGLVSDVNIMVTWQPLCAYTTTVRGKGSVSADACSGLGIHLVHKPQIGITHYLTSHYAATLPHATSLLAMASIVKPEWLQEVIRLGDAPPESPEGIEAGATYLEETFRLPSVTGYRPTFAPALSPAHKRFNVWEPNGTRMNMFLGCRFLCLREKATEADKALVDAIVQGNGTYEVVDVQQGAVKFRLALGKGLRKEGTKKLIVVADADAMSAAVGQDGWKEFEAEAKNSGLEIIPPSTFIRAVLDVDIDVLPSPSQPSMETVTSESTSKSSDGPPLLLSRVPNSIPDSSSVETTDEGLLALPLRAPRRRVTRASQSQEPSEVVLAPTPALQTDEDILKELMARPPPRRATRRIPSEPPFITGLNDPSVVIDGTPLPPRIPSPPMEFDFTVPAPPRSRLKRRVGVTDAGSLLTPASAVPDTPIEEPPLKKFKALFEETNPNSGNIDWENVEVGGAGWTPGTGFSETQTQTLSDGAFDSQRPPPSSRRGLGVPLSESTLALLREEEEEGTQSQMRGVKRSLDVVQEDEEMDDGDATSSTLHGNKRRAVGDGVTAGGGAMVDQVPLSNVSPTSPAHAPAGTQLKTKGNPGAPAGKPDKDAAFLKAIASTKRGKKVEDEFDREFNKLKIARPELDSRAQQEEEWKVLADFGDDSGLRGNFMTVVEIDVYRRDGPGGEQAPREVRREWDGRPNFKKFKKKVNGASRAKVEVFISGDYGMGPEYWKSTNTQAHNSQWSSNSQSQPRPQSLSQVDNVTDDWQVRTESAPRKVEPIPGASLFDSGEENARSPPRTQRRGTSRAVPPKKATVPKAKAKVATKAKKSTLFLDSEDDDNDDVAAAGSGGEGGEVWAESMTLRSDGEAGAEESPIKVRKSSRKKVAPAVFEDDSDGGFSGFKGMKGKVRK